MLRIILLLTLFTICRGFQAQTADIVWQNPIGIAVNSSTITKTADGTQWGNAGVNTLNILKNSEVGAIQYKLRNTTTSFAFGLDAIDTSKTRHYTDIKRGFLFNNGLLYVYSNGVVLASLGTAKTNDKVMMVKKPEKYEYFLNNILMYNEARTDTNTLRMEVAMKTYNTSLLNLQLNFYARIRTNAFKQDGAVYDQNTGFVEMNTKYGLPPYRYTWSNGSNANVIYDLAPGDYSVSVTDSLYIDTVAFSFSIGQKASWADVVNMTFGENEYTKIDPALPASAITANYVEANTDGWYEFRLLDMTTDFDFVLQEFTLPEKIKSKFHGVRLVDEKLYPIFGNEVQAPSLSAKAGDLIRIGRKDAGSVFYIKVNGTQVFQQAINPTYHIAGSFKLWDKRIIIGGPLTFAPGRLEGLLETCLDLKNSTKNTLYDGAGNVVSESVDYFDNMGRHLQTLERNVSQNNIIATQTIYDAYGRAVVQTLPAPIFNWGLCYKSDFVTTGEGAMAFNYNHFDKPDIYGSSGEQSNPAPLNQSTMGSLGWYYSNNNNVEPFVAAAQNPYSRIEYNSLNTTDIKKMSKAGNHLGHGSGHEQYAFTMPTAGELNYMFGYGGSWTMNDLVMAFTGNDYTGQINPAFYPNAGEIALKEISRDENGVEAVTFTDVKGNMIGSCLAGKQNGVNVKIQQVQSVIKPLEEARRFVDVHLPDGCESSLKLYQAPGSSNYVYNIYDLKTGKTILFSGSENYNGTNPTLVPGFYRIYLKSCPFNALSSIPVLQKLNYYNFTLNYYDKANRHKVTVPPNGYDSAYSFLPQIVNTGTRVHFNALSNNKTYTGNMSTVDWSMNSGSFSNEVALTLPAPTSLQLSNVIVSITHKKDWSTVSMPSSGTQQRTAVDYYAPVNFAEPTVVLDTIDFNPPLTGYDSTGAVYYTVPTPGNGGGNPDPCNSILAVPFRFWFQLQDQNGTPLTDIYNNPASVMQLATCYFYTCLSGNTYRVWDLPPVLQYYINPAQAASITALKIKITDVKAYTGQPFNSSILYDLEATIGVNTHQLPSLPQHSMQEINQYNSWDELLTSYKPDAGRMDYVYSKDGKSRYSQNSKQDASHGNAVSRNFSYINYDAFDRPVEKGEFLPQATYSGSAPANSYFESYSENLLNGNPADPTSIINKADIALDDHFRTHERVAIAYDLPDPDFYTFTGLSATNYKQEYVTGDVSFSYNEQKRTWYSYDELGRTVWMVQRYENTGGLGGFIIKTFNYTYDFLGNIMQIAYQKEDASESFYHYYVYDADKRLKKVYTSRDGLNRKEEAAYYYYLHGPLKRVELANKLQGIDYVYTINGWLKNMNAPEMDNLRDPGKDGKMNTLVPKDLFGMSLDYFDGDYERASTYVQTYPEPQNSNPSVAPDLFNGIIKAQRWQTKTPAGGSALAYQGQHLFYGYNYDKKYQLKEANFGVWDADGTQNYPVGEGIANDMNVNLSNDYKVHSMTYDYNGNIKSLTRNAYAAGSGGINLDDLNYSYLGNSNKLEKVNDAVNTNLYASLGYNPGQGANNFQYNVMGELISDTRDNKAYEYNSFGQITRVTDLLANPIVEYEYDEGGQRVLKRAFNGSNTTTTMYVRDGGGQVMAIYEKTTAAPAYAVKEWNVYGANRIATAYEVGNTEPERTYEMGDHLGNSRTTFKPGLVTSATFNFNGNGTYDYLITDPASTIDYTVNMNGGAGGSIKVVYPSQAVGAGINRIPVKYGQTVTVTGYALYNGSGISPNTKLQLELVDENGILLAGNNLAGAPIPIGAGTWNQFNISFQVTENYPEMYIKLSPVANLSPSNKVAWFDNIQVQLSGTGAGIRVPEQMSAASYYPHGSVMPGLNYSSTLGGRYGYQGQYAELDKEINESFFELRNYNPLTARFNTTDPKEQHFSPYLAMGNSPTNQIDPDGGFSGSWVGAAVGAGVGLGIAAYLDYKDNGKLNVKQNWWKYAAWGGGGFVVGGIAGGLIQNGGNLKDAEFWGSTVKRAVYKKRSLFGKWYLEKSNPIHFNIKVHFSLGFRVANWVLLDIRFNSTKNNAFQKNFPGRWNLNPKATMRFSLFYFVWHKNPGHYKIFPQGYPLGHSFGCFYGGYTEFTEHLGVDATNVTHRK